MTRLRKIIYLVFTASFVLSNESLAMTPCEDSVYYTFHNPIMAPIVDLRMLYDLEGPRASIASGLTYSLDTPSECRGGIGIGAELEYDTRHRGVYGVGFNGMGSYGARVSVMYKRSFEDKNYQAVQFTIGAMALGVIVGYDFGHSVVIGVVIGGGYAGIRDQKRIPDREQYR